MIKVFITDDHQVIRQGIQGMLSGFNQIDVVASYSSAEELLKGLETQQPDVLLLDVQMPGKNGIETAEYISKHYHTVKIIAFTNENALVQVKKMLQYCKGYLWKDTEGPILVKAIETVHKGDNFLQEGLKERLYADMFHSQKKTSNTTLSKREKEILKLIVEGMNSRDIAQKLFLGARTVESHRYNLMQKMNVKNVAEMVKVALEGGLV